METSHYSIIKRLYKSVFEMYRSGVFSYALLEELGADFPEDISDDLKREASAMSDLLLDTFKKTTGILNVVTSQQYIKQEYEKEEISQIKQSFDCISEKIFYCLSNGSQNFAPINCCKKK